MMLLYLFSEKHNLSTQQTCHFS